MSLPLLCVTIIGPPTNLVLRPPLPQHSGIGYNSSKELYNSQSFSSTDNRSSQAIMSGIPSDGYDVPKTGRIVVQLFHLVEKLLQSCKFPYESTEKNNTIYEDLRFNESMEPSEMFQVNGQYNADIPQCLLNGGENGFREPMFMGETCPVNWDISKAIPENELYYCSEYRHCLLAFPLPDTFFSDDYNLYRNLFSPNPNLFFAPGTHPVMQKIILSNEYEKSKKRYLRIPAMHTSMQRVLSGFLHAEEETDVSQDIFFIFHFQGFHLFGFHRFLKHPKKKGETLIQNMMTGSTYLADAFKGVAGPEWSKKLRQKFFYETAATLHMCETMIACDSILSSDHMDELYRKYPAIFNRNNIVPAPTAGTSSAYTSQRNIPGAIRTISTSSQRIPRSSSQAGPVSSQQLPSSSSQARSKSSQRLPSSSPPVGSSSSQQLPSSGSQGASSSKTPQKVARPQDESDRKARGTQDLIKRDNPQAKSRQFEKSTTYTHHQDKSNEMPENFLEDTPEKNSSSDSDDKHSDDDDSSKKKKNVKAKRNVAKDSGSDSSSDGGKKTKNSKKNNKKNNKKKNAKAKRKEPVESPEEESDSDTSQKKEAEPKKVSPPPPVNPLHRPHVAATIKNPEDGKMKLGLYMVTIGSPQQPKPPFNFAAAGKAVPPKPKYNFAKNGGRPIPNATPQFNFRGPPVQGSMSPNGPPGLQCQGQNAYPGQGSPGQNNKMHPSYPSSPSPNFQNSSPNMSPGQQPSSGGNSPMLGAQQGQKPCPQGQQSEQGNFLPKQSGQFPAPRMPMQRPPPMGGNAALQNNNQMQRPPFQQNPGQPLVPGQNRPMHPPQNYPPGAVPGHPMPQRPGQPYGPNNAPYNNNMQRPPQQVPGRPGMGQPIQSMPQRHPQMPFHGPHPRPQGIPNNGMIPMGNNGQRQFHPHPRPPVNGPRPAQYPVPGSNTVINLENGSKPFGKPGPRPPQPRRTGPNAPPFAFKPSPLVKGAAINTTGNNICQKTIHLSPKGPTGTGRAPENDKDDTVQENIAPEPSEHPSVSPSGSTPSKSPVLSDEPVQESPEERKPSLEPIEDDASPSTLHHKAVESTQQSKSTDSPQQSPEPLVEDNVENNTLHFDELEESEPIALTKEAEIKETRAERSTVSKSLSPAASFEDMFDDFPDQNMEPMSEEPVEKPIEKMQLSPPLLMKQAVEKTRPPMQKSANVSTKMVAKPATAAPAVQVVRKTVQPKKMTLEEHRKLQMQAKNSANPVAANARQPIPMTESPRKLFLSGSAAHQATSLASRTAIQPRFAPNGAILPSNIRIIKNSRPIHQMEKPLPCTIKKIPLTPQSIGWTGSIPNPMRYGTRPMVVANRVQVVQRQVMNGNIQNQGYRKYAVPPAQRQNVPNLQKVQQLPIAKKPMIVRKTKVPVLQNVQARPARPAVPARQNSNYVIHRAEETENNNPETQITPEPPRIVYSDAEKQELLKFINHEHCYTSDHPRKETFSDADKSHVVIPMSPVERDTHTIISQPKRLWRLNIPPVVQSRYDPRSQQRRSGEPDPRMLAPDTLNNDPNKRKRGRPRKGMEIPDIPAVEAENSRRPKTRTRNNPEIPAVDDTGVTHERRPKKRKIEETMEGADAETSAAVMKAKSIEESPSKNVADPDAADKKIRGRPKRVVRPRGKKGAKLKRIATALEIDFLIESKLDIPDDLENVPEEEREILQQEAREMGITRGMYSPQRKPKPSARALKKQLLAEQAFKTIENFLDKVTENEEDEEKKIETVRLIVRKGFDIPHVDEPQQPEELESQPAADIHFDTIDSVLKFDFNPTIKTEKPAEETKNFESDNVYEEEMSTSACHDYPEDHNNFVFDFPENDVTAEVDSDKNERTLFDAISQLVDNLNIYHTEDGVFDKGEFTKAFNNSVVLTATDQPLFSKIKIAPAVFPEKRESYFRYNAEKMSADKEIPMDTTMIDAKKTVDETGEASLDSFIQDSANETEHNFKIPTLPEKYKTAKKAEDDDLAIIHEDLQTLPETRETVEEDINILHHTISAKPSDISMEPLLPDDILEPCAESVSYPEMHILTKALELPAENDYDVPMETTVMDSEMVEFSIEETPLFNAISMFVDNLNIFHETDNGLKKAEFSNEFNNSLALMAKDEKLFSSDAALLAAFPEKREWYHKKKAQKEAVQMETTSNEAEKAAGENVDVISSSAVVTTDNDEAASAKVAPKESNSINESELFTWEMSEKKADSEALPPLPEKETVGSIEEETMLTVEQDLPSSTETSIGDESVSPMVETTSEKPSAEEKVIPAEMEEETEEERSDRISDEMSSKAIDNYFTDYALIDEEEESMTDVSLDSSIVSAPPILKETCESFVLPAKSMKQGEPCQLAVVNGDFNLEQDQEKDNVENTFVEPVKVETLEESFAETAVTTDFTNSMEEASGDIVLADKNFGSLEANFSDEKATLDVDLTRSEEKEKAGTSWWKEEEKSSLSTTSVDPVFERLDESEEHVLTVKEPNRQQAESFACTTVDFKFHGHGNENDEYSGTWDIPHEIDGENLAVTNLEVRRVASPGADSADFTVDLKNVEKAEHSFADANIEKTREQEKEEIAKTVDIYHKETLYQSLASKDDEFQFAEQSDSTDRIWKGKNVEKVGSGIIVDTQKLEKTFEKETALLTVITVPPVKVSADFKEVIVEPATEEIETSVEEIPLEEELIVQIAEKPIEAEEVIETTEDKTIATEENEGKQEDQQKERHEEPTLEEMTLPKLQEEPVSSEKDLSKDEPQPSSDIPQELQEKAVSQKETLSVPSTSTPVKKGFKRPYPPSEQPSPRAKRALDDETNCESSTQPTSTASTSTEVVLYSPHHPTTPDFSINSPISVSPFRPEDFAYDAGAKTLSPIRVQSRPLVQMSNDWEKTIGGIGRRPLDLVSSLLDKGKMEMENKEILVEHSSKKEEKTGTSEDNLVTKQKETGKECQSTIAEANERREDTEKGAVMMQPTLKNIILIGRDECITAIARSCGVQSVVEKMVPMNRIIDEPEDEFEDHRDSQDEYVPLYQRYAPEEVLRTQKVAENEGKKDVAEEVVYEEEEDEAFQDKEIELPEEPTVDEALENEEMELLKELFKEPEETNSAKIVKPAAPFIDPAKEDEIVGLRLEYISDETSVKRRKVLKKRLKELGVLIKDDVASPPAVKPPRRMESRRFMQERRSLRFMRAESEQSFDQPQAEENVVSEDQQTAETEQPLFDNEPSEEDKLIQSMIDAEITSVDIFASSGVQETEFQQSATSASTVPEFVEGLLKKHEEAEILNQDQLVVSTFLVSDVTAQYQDEFPISSTDPTNSEVHDIVSKSVHAKPTPEAEEAERELNKHLVIIKDQEAQGKSRRSLSPRSVRQLQSVPPPSENSSSSSALSNNSPISVASQQPLSVQQQSVQSLQSVSSASAVLDNSPKSAVSLQPLSVPQPLSHMSTVSPSQRIDALQAPTGQQNVNMQPSAYLQTSSPQENQVSVQQSSVGNSFSLHNGHMPSPSLAQRLPVPSFGNGQTQQSYQPFPAYPDAQRNQENKHYHLSPGAQLPQWNTMNAQQMQQPMAPNLQQRTPTQQLQHMAPNLQQGTPPQQLQHMAPNIQPGTSQQLQHPQNPLLLVYNQQQLQNRSHFPGMAIDPAGLPYYNGAACSPFVQKTSPSVPPTQPASNSRKRGAAKRETQATPPKRGRRSKKNEPVTSSPVTPNRQLQQQNVSSSSHLCAPYQGYHGQPRVPHPQYNYHQQRQMMGMGTPMNQGNSMNMAHQHMYLQMNPNYNLYSYQQQPMVAQQMQQISPMPNQQFGQEHTMPVYNQAGTSAPQYQKYGSHYPVPTAAIGLSQEDYWNNTVHNMAATAPTLQPPNQIGYGNNQQQQGHQMPMQQHQQMQQQHLQQPQQQGNMPVHNIYAMDSVENDALCYYSELQKLPENTVVVEKLRIILGMIQTNINLQQEKQFPIFSRLVRMVKPGCSDEELNAFIACVYSTQQQIPRMNWPRGRSFTQVLHDALKAHYRQMCSDAHGREPEIEPDYNVCNEITDLAEFYHSRGRLTKISVIKTTRQEIETELNKAGNAYTADDYPAKCPSLNENCRFPVQPSIDFFPTEGYQISDEKCSEFTQNREYGFVKTFQDSQRPQSFIEQLPPPVLLIHLDVIDPQRKTCVQCHDYFLQEITVKYEGQSFSCLRSAPLLPRDSNGEKCTSFNTNLDLPESDRFSQFCKIFLTRDPPSTAFTMWDMKTPLYSYMLIDGKLIEKLENQLENLPVVGNGNSGFNDQGAPDDSNNGGGGSFDPGDGKWTGGEFGEITFSPTAFPDGSFMMKTLVNHGDFQHCLVVKNLQSLAFTKQDHQYLLRKNTAPMFTSSLPLRRYCELSIETRQSWDIVDHFCQFESYVSKMRDYFSKMILNLGGMIKNSSEPWKVLLETQLNFCNVWKNNWSFGMLLLSDEIFSPTRCVKWHSCSRKSYECMRSTSQSLYAAMEQIFSEQMILGFVKSTEKEIASKNLSEREKQQCRLNAAYNILSQIFVDENLKKKLAIRPLWNTAARENVEDSRSFNAAFNLTSNRRLLDANARGPLTEGVAHALGNIMQLYSSLSSFASNRQRLAAACNKTLLFKETCKTRTIYYEAARGVVSELKNGLDLDPSMRPGDIDRQWLRSLPQFTAQMVIARYIMRRNQFLVDAVVSDANKAIQRTNVILKSAMRNAVIKPSGTQLIFNTNMLHFGPTLNKLMPEAEVIVEDLEPPAPPPEKKKRHVSGSSLPSIPAKSIRLDDGSKDESKTVLQHAAELPHIPSPPMSSRSSVSNASVIETKVVAASVASDDSGFASLPSIVTSCSDEPTSTARLAVQEAKAAQPLTIKSDFEFVVPRNANNTPQNSPSADSLFSVRLNKNRRKSQVSPADLSSMLKTLLTAAEVVESHSRSNSDREPSEEPPVFRQKARILPKRRVLNRVLSDGKHKYAVKIDFFAGTVYIDRKNTNLRSKRMRPEDAPAPIIAELFEQGKRELKLFVKDGQPDWHEIRRVAMLPPLTPRTPILPGKLSRSQSPSEDSQDALENTRRIARKLFRKPLPVTTELLPEMDSSKESTPFESDSGDSLKMECPSTFLAPRIRREEKARSVASTVTISTIDTIDIGESDEELDVENTSDGGDLEDSEFEDDDKLLIVTDEEDLEELAKNNKAAAPSSPEVVQMDVLSLDSPKRLESPIDVEFCVVEVPQEFEVLPKKEDLRLKPEEEDYVFVPEKSIVVKEEFQTPQKEVIKKEEKFTPETPKSAHQVPCRSRDKYARRKLERYAEILKSDPPQVVTDQTLHLENMESVRQAVDAAEKERMRMLNLTACDDAFRRISTKNETRRPSPAVLRRSRSADKWFGRTVYKHFGEFWVLGLARLAKEKAVLKERDEPCYVSRCNSPATIAPWDDDYQASSEEDLLQAEQLQMNQLPVKSNEEKLVFPINVGYRKALDAQSTSVNMDEVNGPQERPERPRFFRTRRTRYT